MRVAFVTTVFHSWTTKERSHRDKCLCCRASDLTWLTGCWPGVTHEPKVSWRMSEIMFTLCCTTPHKWLCVFIGKSTVTSWGRKLLQDQCFVPYTFVAWGCLDSKTDVFWWNSQLSQWIYFEKPTASRNEHEIFSVLLQDCVSMKSRRVFLIRSPPDNQSQWNVYEVDHTRDTNLLVHSQKKLGNILCATLSHSATLAQKAIKYEVCDRVKWCTVDCISS
jgi:hypothetical protein